MTSNVKKYLNFDDTNYRHSLSPNLLGVNTIKSYRKQGNFFIIDILKIYNFICFYIFLWYWTAFIE